MENKSTLTNDKSHFELKEYGGLVYPVVKRKKNAHAIDKCPYCGEQHMHSHTLGHRVASCTKDYLKEIEINRTIIPQGRGYFIEEY